MSEMFCFQCEQTSAGKGCTGHFGVCGKNSQLASLQDRLTGALISLATGLAPGLQNKAVDRLFTESLFATLTNVNFDEDSINELLNQVKLANDLVSQNSPSGQKDYDLNQLWTANEDIRSLKSLVLLGIRGVAAYAWHAAVLGSEDQEVYGFIKKALKALGEESYGLNELLPIIMETGRINLRIMEILDKANTDAFGTPEPTTVSLTVEKGPFIVVSGHDLLDLKLLLEQTEDQGLNVYTHGETLPAHAYPELKKFSHLKGNFGTAWQNQQKEFENIPGPVIFTTNCIMPVKDSYRDRVFTSSVVRYPGLVHIDRNKDFSQVIQKAKELGGYPENRVFSGINGGHKLTTGFGHGAVLAAADTVVSAVKSGAIKHFFLVGGCDGAKPGRNYFTEFVKQAPKDTIILTLACGKYRFNDLDLGEIGGLPRIMDMGQCNDAYSAIKVAATLAEVFGCGINDLPLTLVISWYEQKAVSILLTLLHLGLKNILLGPSLPAFISPNVLKFLVDKFSITPISSPEEDLKKILKDY